MARPVWECKHGYNITRTLYEEILAAEAALPRDEQKGFKHRIPGAVPVDSPFWGVYPGVISTGLGSLLRSEEKSPFEEGGPSEGGCMREQVRLWLRCPRYILTAQLVSFSIEGLSGISRLCRVSEECPIIISPRRGGNTNRGVLEGTWDSALNFINKHNSRLTAATG